MTTAKKLFRHGGSYAIDLPMSFVRHSPAKEVLVEEEGDKIVLHHVSDLDTIESEPEFALFVRALMADALKHPGRMKQAKEVWDKEWDRLLKGVNADE